MTIEEKLGHFKSVTIVNTHGRCEDSLNTYKNELDEQFEKHKAEAIRNAKLREKTLVDAIERKASKEYTMEQLHLKRKIKHKQDDVKKDLLTKVEAELAIFRNKSEYKDLLVRQIKSALDFANNDEIQIFIEAEDEPLKAALEAECKVTLNISERPTKGGIRAEIQSKNILIDNTFATKLEESMEKFMITL